MKPEIQHIGHAGIKYTYGRVTLFMDPWFNPAFLKSWFPYPDNREFEYTARNDADYIYISHAHEDHFDREFLKTIDPTFTTLIVPRFRSHYLLKELHQLGFAGPFSPLVLGHGESTILPGNIKLTMLIDRSHKEDSALLVEAGGHRFLNSNDCELAIPDWPKDIDLLAAQYSGASWYPQCYDFSPGVLAVKSQAYRQANLTRLYRRVKLTGASSYLPSAGPAVFLDPALRKYNNETVFPVWNDVNDEFCEACPDVEIWPYLNDYPDIPYYSAARADEWGKFYDAPEVVPVSGNELFEHFRQLQLFNKRFIRNWHKDVKLSSGNQWWQVRLDLIADELEELFNPTYFLDVPPRVLREVIDGRATWETALLSQRITLARRPDVYDSTLMGLLNFGDRPVQTVTMSNQQEASEFTSKDGYEFQRWCPHAGEDLSYARVEDGKITCPRHEWSWDANTGECVSGGDIPLKVRKSE